VREADPVERVERRAGDERPRVVGGDDPLTGDDAGGRIASGRARDPVVEVARRQRDVARIARRAARRVDPDDLGALDAEVRADRILARVRRPELVLVGQRQLGDVVEARRFEAPELLAVEG
jgi:hypothetical protein